jgi:beta-glucosidase
MNDRPTASIPPAAVDQPGSVPTGSASRSSTPVPPLPPHFVLGAATSAFQIEGAVHEDGRRDSIWDAFCRIPGAVLGGDDGEPAADAYHRFGEDVALMADLGLQAYRFSTSWARVRPDGVTGPAGINHAGLDHYSRLVDALLEHGIAPWLTLYHWDLPQALQAAGGWTARDTALRFVEYTQTVHDALGDRVQVWTTHNEPWCAAFLGYTAGLHAPGHRSPAQGLRAAHHLLLSHGLATNLLRSLAPEATIAITLNFTPGLPADPTDPVDLAAVRRFDAQMNRIFLDPLLRGGYSPDLLEELATAGLDGVLAEVVQDGDLATISTPIDLLGVNYYNDEQVTGHVVAPQAAAPTPGGWTTGSPFPVPGGWQHVARDLPTTGMGWEVHPDGLRDLLLRLHREYTGPAGIRLAVTENGAAYPDVVDPDGQVRDEDRRSYLQAHLHAVQEAVAEGADVVAYLAWSLLDNFEWSFGYSQRFGLVHVDFATQRRTVKSSGQWFGELARARRAAARQVQVR